MDKKKHNENWLHNPNVKRYSLASVMENAFGRYAKYIIQDRALPDVRDGLKPVQRRILFAMNNLGLYQNRPYKKSARTVGEVIGKYHPHGDSSIYEAMVRMSQDWKNNTCLIDMQGNNGSIDGDGAAAMRYTECRLSPMSMTMLANIDKNTVEWVYNFDDSEKEPVILPSLYPNLLVNGAQGIAAGYATNMPPHNPTEILNALKFLLKHPEASLSDIMQYIPGPDFPTGGVINGNQGILDAYESGKGKLELNCKYELRTTNKNFYEVVITDIPFDIKKSELVKQIAVIAFGEEIDGIENVTDESDQNGVNIVLQIKKDKNLDTIMGYLLKKTALSQTYSINNTVISNKKPVCLGMKALLDEHLNHCFNMLIKASQYDLNKALQKLEIVEGFIRCIKILEEVIPVIRTSKNKQDAKENLMKRFMFSDVQAEAILNMKLYRLTNTDYVELENDRASLKQKIADLKLLISNHDKQIEVLTKVFDEYIDEFGFDRKTQIVNNAIKLDIDSKELVANDKWILGISNYGYLKLLTPRSWNNDKSLSEYAFNNEKDSLVFLENVYSLDTVVLITKFGKLVCLPVHKLKPNKVKDKGNHLNDFVTLLGDDQIVGAFLLKNDQVYFDSNLVMLSKQGMIKATNFNELVSKSSLKSTSIMKLNDGDEIISFSIVKTDQKYFVNVIASNGNTSCFESDQIPVQSKTSAGVLAMKLKDKDYLLGMAMVASDQSMWAVCCENDYQVIKQASVDVTNRNTTGKNIFSSKLKLNKVIGIFSFNPDTVFIGKETNNNCVITLSNYKLDKMNGYENHVKLTGLCMIETTQNIMPNKPIKLLDLE